MALHKAKLKGGFKLPTCEKHFHDHDETWLILKGRGTGYWIDHDGRREDFLLEEGDAWMIPAGFEHGSFGFKETGKNGEDFTIAVFNGTEAPGCQPPKHYYVEKEGYIPSLELKRTPTNRYKISLNLPAKMRAVVFVEKGNAVLQEEPMPECPPGHLLCQTLFSGVTNGTERNVLLGGNYFGGTWPTRVGYQNVARVIETNGAAAGFGVGDLVYSGSGFGGNGGGHAGFYAVNPARPPLANLLFIKLPPGVDPKHAALSGMASVAVHDVRHAGIKLGEDVLVVGAGSVGLFTAQCAKAAGAKVVVCDVDDRRLGLARQLGARQTFNTKDETGWAALLNRGPFDAVFEDSGAPILDKIIGLGYPDKGLIKRRGKVVMIAGRVRVDYSFNAAQHVELTVIHAGHFVRSDLEEMARLIAEGVIKIGPIIQDVLPIAEAPALYERLRDNPSSLIGTVFDWA
jgi:2-desacetyl-2-hydroxyethyl bacteriochlorophyllide A dehydrogenase